MSFFLVAFLLSTIAAATPLLLAAVGELVVEKVGVLQESDQQVGQYLPYKLFFLSSRFR